MSLKSVTSTIDGIINAAMLVFLVCCMASLDFARSFEIVAVGCMILACIGVMRCAQYRQRAKTIEATA